MFDDIAADCRVGAEQQELARIRAAGLLVDSATYADMQQRLETDTAPEGDLPPHRARTAGAVGLARQRH